MSRNYAKVWGPFWVDFGGPDAHPWVGVEALHAPTHKNFLLRIPTRYRAADASGLDASEEYKVAEYLAALLNREGGFKR